MLAIWCSWCGASASDSFLCRVERLSAGLNVVELRSSCHVCLCQCEPRGPTVSLTLYANEVPRSHHVRNVGCSMEVLIASDVCVEGPCIAPISQ